MNTAYTYCNNGYDEKAHQISSDALRQIDVLREHRDIKSIAFFIMLLEKTVSNTEMLVFSVNISVVVGNPVFVPALDQLRQITRKIEDDVLNNQIIENVPNIIVQKLRKVNMDLVDAICQLEIATNPEIDKVFDGRELYA